MPIPTVALESHLIGAARQRAAELLEVFAAATVAGEPASLLCARASATFDGYCDGLLDGLLTAVEPVGGAENEWVREHYLPLVIEFGTATRDAIADPTSRHVAAQAIQCKILEHERHLRIVMESDAVTHSPLARATNTHDADHVAAGKPLTER